VHKDELALNVGTSLTEKGTMLSANLAYPSVVSTLGDMTTTTKGILIGLYAEGKSGRDFMRVKQQIANACKNEAEFRRKFHCPAGVDVNKAIMETKNLPYFTAQGVALGIAYASSLSGDTVASVLIGGMCTVMNGAFEVRAGQMLQFYFDFEAGAFHRDNGVHPAGTRKKGANILFGGNHAQVEEFMKPPKLTAQDELRNQFHKRQLGTENSFGEPGAGPGGAKKNVAYVKPYMLDEDGNDHYGDRVRIFAKAISGGRCHEPIDIMLMTQSL
tara:strand:+ start:4039 stop:4854 length:816 start_codon:yes stop_codon:yes gene_type:complete